MRTSRRRLIRFVVAGASALMLMPATPASAGRLVATGHDADHHCGREEEAVRHRQCHFFQVAVEYVRAGAPDPAKPVLVLDRGKLDVVLSLDRIYGPGAVPRAVFDPRSSAFAAEPITTDRYSAVIVASSKGDPKDPTPQDLNEFDSAPDSIAINKRASALRAFFNAGGGIFVNSGSTHGDNPDDPYYGFLPVTVQGARVAEPFRLTDAGRALGLVDADVTCCATHNTFEPMGEGSALRPIDLDKANRIVSVFADVPKFESLQEAPITRAEQQQIASALPPTSKCVIPRRSITLRLKRPRRVRFSRATVFLNGKRVKRLRGRRITRPIRLRMPSKGRAKVRVVIVTTGKRRITIRRTYSRCRFGQS